MILKLHKKIFLTSCWLQSIPQCEDWDQARQISSDPNYDHDDCDIDGEPDITIILTIILTKLKNLLDRRGRARAVQVHGDNNLSVVALDFNDNFIGGTTGESLFRRTYKQPLRHYRYY